MNDPLIALVCGFEKSGTTLLNEILRRHPQLDSGFEGGMLLGNSPREFPRFQPYYAFFRQCWELSRQDMHYICDTDDWQESYRRARERTPVITNKRSHLFDKTPIYMRHLDEVLEKVPNLPCIVTVRDPRALMLSWATWSGHGENPETWLRENFESNCDRYLSYARGYDRALERHGERILLNRFEDLCLHPEPMLRSVFRFIGLEFDPAYLQFSSKHFVYGNRISTDYLFPYRHRLSAHLCERILAATQEYQNWHFDANHYDGLPPC